MEIFNRLVNIIDKDCKGEQRAFLETISEDIRWIPVDLLLEKYKAFYVPNDNYIYEALNKETEILKSKYNTYRYHKIEMEHVCKWTGRLVIPIRDLRGDVVAFVGYSNELEPKYDYNNFIVWKKSKYTFCTREMYFKGLEDGYMFLFDGVMDSIIMEYLGYNTASLMGSAVTTFAKEFVKHIEHPILGTDNDVAGRKLEKKLSYANSNLIEVVQDVDDDMYDYFVDREKNSLRRGRIEDFREKFRQAKKRGFLVDIDLRRERCTTYIQK